MKFKDNRARKKLMATNRIGQVEANRSVVQRLMFTGSWFSVQLFLVQSGSLAQLYVVT